MGKRKPSAKETLPGNIQPGHSTSPQPCNNTQETGGKILELGTAFIKTVKHFWPDFSQWLACMPDTRFQPFVIYHRNFLIWWGILLFVLKLGSRRQLDFDLRDEETSILENINRLAGTKQQSLPVHDTLDHFLTHLGSEPIAELRTLMIRQLIRMKALDGIRLEGYFVVGIDGTGHLSFHKRHCPQCIAHSNGSATFFLHPVVEAKILGEDGLALSIGSEVIENPLQMDDTNPEDYEKKKQDCELKAFARLATQLKRDFPQTPICISGDSLLGCGTPIQICEDNNWKYLFVFKEGRMKAVWEDFQELLSLSPENTLRLQLPDGTLQVYRWVNDMSYEDDQKRTHQFNAILCKETTPDGVTTTFAWITNFSITANKVAAISTKGGRKRWVIENEGFNVQKNSQLNLEHAYSFHRENLKSFYILVQIAHIMLQLLEKGSLLKKLAKTFGKTPLQLFGSLKNIARRLLEAFRYTRIPDTAFDENIRFQIRLDTS